MALLVYTPFNTITTHSCSRLCPLSCVIDLNHKYNIKKFKIIF
jgi:hypothetical protein